MWDHWPTVWNRNFRERCWIDWCHVRQWYPSGCWRHPMMWCCWWLTRWMALFDLLTYILHNNCRVGSSWLLKLIRTNPVDQHSRGRGLNRTRCVTAKLRSSTDRSKYTSTRSDQISQEFPDRDFHSVKFSVWFGPGCIHSTVNDLPFEYYIIITNMTN